VKQSGKSVKTTNNARTNYSLISAKSQSVIWQLINVLPPTWKMELLVMTTIYVRPVICAKTVFVREVNKRTVMTTIRVPKICVILEPVVLTKQWIMERFAMTETVAQQTIRAKTDSVWAQKKIAMTTIRVPMTAVIVLPELAKISPIRVTHVTIIMHAQKTIPVKTELVRVLRFPVQAVIPVFLTHVIPQLVV